MRWVLRGGVLGLLLVVTACKERQAAPSPVDGSLVLELGGPQGSLREALAARGVAIGPGHVLRDPPAPVEAPPAPGPTGGTAPEPTKEPEPQPEPLRGEPGTPPAPAEAEYRTVSLRRGQTLIHLAKEHLGDGNRFRELLTLNGWTEADARRLADGTQVRVPIARKAPAKPKR